MSAGVLKMSSHPQKGILLGCCYGKLYHCFPALPMLRYPEDFSHSVIHLLHYLWEFLMWQSHEPGDTAANRTDQFFALRRLTF